MCDPIDGHYLMDGGYTNLVPGKVLQIRITFSIKRNNKIIYQSRFSMLF